MNAAMSTCSWLHAHNRFLQGLQCDQGCRRCNHSKCEGDNALHIPPDSMNLTMSMTKHVNTYYVEVFNVIQNKLVPCSCVARSQPTYSSLALSILAQPNSIPLLTSWYRPAGALFANA
jgi:hypothetical protein